MIEKPFGIQHHGQLSLLYLRLSLLILFLQGDQFHPATVYSTFTPQDNTVKCSV